MDIKRELAIFAPLAFDDAAEPPASFVLLKWGRTDTGFIEVSSKNSVNAFGDTPEDALQRLFDTLDDLMTGIRNLFYEQSKEEENDR